MVDNISQKDNFTISTCTSCQKTFNTIFELRTHALIHDQGKPIQNQGWINCKICKLPVEATDFPKHELLHKNPQTMGVKQLISNFTKAKSGGGVGSKNGSNSKSGGTFQCTMCDSSFVTLVQLKNHNLMKHGMHTCDLTKNCGSTFSTLQHLKRHWIFKHKLDTTKVLEQTKLLYVTNKFNAKSHKCDICKKTFVNNNSSEQPVATCEKDDPQDSCAHLRDDLCDM